MDATPEAQLRAATARRKRLEKQLAAARLAERSAMFDALAVGDEPGKLRQAGIVAVTEYTREHVRRLTEAEADARGVPRPGARAESEA